MVQEKMMPQAERFASVWAAQKVAKQAIDAAVAEVLAAQSEVQRQIAKAKIEAGLIAMLDAESEGCARVCDEIASEREWLQTTPLEAATAMRCANEIRAAIGKRVPG